MESNEKLQLKKQKRESARLQRRFTATFLAQNRASFLITLGTVILLCALELLLAWLIQQILDAAAGSDAASLLRTVFCFLIAFFLFLAASMIRRCTFSCFMQRAMRQYKEYAFVEITKKSIGSFNQENTGRYISALTNDATSIETNYLEKCFTLIMQSLLFCGALTMMFCYSPLLTGIAVLISMLPVAASLICGKRLTDKEKAVSIQNENFMSMLKDLLTGFPVIKSFKAEKEVTEQFAEQNRELESCKRARRMTADTIDIIGTSTGLLAQFGVFFAGAFLAVTENSITTGVVIVFVQLMNYVLQPISTVPALIANRKAALALIDKLAQAVSSNTSRSGKPVGQVLNDKIEIRSLTFGYEPEQVVLKDITLDFEAGKSYALVGSSGSGKSTLLNLLMGSYENYSGSIRFDGDELRTICTDSLYDMISMIQQNVFIFNNTIQNNVTMFREFPQEKIDRAIRMSGLEELIRQRGAGYLCGENGLGLSGGERQRVSIARSLLRETPILLVDEATAALDPATAHAVSSSILDISGLTRVVVTHRLEKSLLRRYDRIVVLRSGRVCEQGTFEELMQKQSYFYSLYTVSAADAADS